MVGCTPILDRPSDTASAALLIAYPLAAPVLIAGSQIRASSRTGSINDLCGGGARRLEAELERNI